MESLTLKQRKAKEYYIRDRDRIKAKSAKYYEDNKPKVLARIKQSNFENPIPNRERAKKFAKKNPERVKKYMEQWLENHPEQRKVFMRNSRIRKYGIQPEIYYKLLNEQENRCAICKQEEEKRNLSIDHCHKTGRVRGLLCSNCNRGIGFLKDNVQFLKNAVQYLAENKENS
jgi:hypothetical protein